ARIGAVGAQTARRPDVRAVGVGAALRWHRRLTDAGTVRAAIGRIALVRRVVDTVEPRRAQLPGEPAARHRLRRGRYADTAAANGGVAFLGTLEAGVASLPAAATADVGFRTGGQGEGALTLQTGGRGAGEGAVGAHTARCIGPRAVRIRVALVWH